MSGIVGKKNSTLKKESVKENKLLTVGVKAIKFWHEASAGETSIPFGTLNMPADVAVNGFSNPTSTEILAANLALFHTNIEVHSSLNQKLIEGLSYVVNNSQVKFINNYVSTEGEIFVVVYKNDTITGTNVVDARPLTATGTLAAGSTDFNVGEAFKTNAYPNDQLGEVLVFIDGEVQYRNVANATASPSADGNYEEVQSAGGFGTIIRVNESFLVDKAIIVISRNLIAERPDISMMQLIENLGGQLDSLISTTAALAGVPETDFQSNPNQIDLKSFGNQVTENGNDITELQKILETEVSVNTPIQTSYHTSSINGGSTKNAWTDTNCSLLLTPGIYSINANCIIHIDSASSGGYMMGMLALTDTANNVIEAVGANGAGTAIDGNGDGTIGTAALSYELTVTETTTYKTRFGAFELSGGLNIMTTVLALSAVLQAGGNGISLTAKRIDNVKIKDLI